MSQALYRKYRSRNLGEVLGQEQVTGILTRALGSGTVSHAYLLTGPHGVGKTSVARIMAHEINQLPYSEDAEHLDIIEIDAASNNGVEDVRELREKVHIAPTTATYKVYIIDEVHMLSKPAFNALLKTLEEPPSHIVFILATTDADKLPATIISRVQRFNFHSIDTATVVKHLANIAKKERINIDTAALELIAEHGNGSFRDSIGLLDQLKDSVDNSTVIDAKAVELALGISSSSLLDAVIDARRNNSLEETVHAIKTIEQTGAQAAVIAKQLIRKIHASIGNHPDEIELLDALLEVSASSHPFIKLLTVMAPRSSSTIQQAATPIPADRESVKPKAKTMAEATVVAPTVTLEAPEIAALPTQPQKLSGDIPETIDWQAIVAAAKSMSISLYSLLRNSSGNYSAPHLTIHAGNNFNHKKLSDPKQQAVLMEVLQSLSADGVMLNIVPGKKPPEDAEMAAIANLMGGGEEVTVDG
ncbi:MAG TPA: DNA polymerase III subunit gamma/tau [Candidatus Saccharibacteria bacterium]|nr:DNA polymerase III subunit gamma/tau [Candidatus Saccharibacteria bacterium]HMR38560.1 DNA polymerase III subunit gamma/tau [Candidatus Saccharibacteria bacterium]